jgi:small subunit ribosomal protein S2
MALPDYNMRQLLEAGVHFGHQTHRWNPKMAPYIFGDRNGIHIIDLAQTVPLLHQALVAVRDTVAAGGRVLFVGTKRQATEVIARTAQQCAQYYMNTRWLGGTLTNWKTISNSINRLRELENLLSDEASTGFTKKEILNLTRERDKLELAIGGVKDMGGLPDLMIVIDTNKESIAIAEAHKLGIPVIAILDSNCNPDGITYPVPGNDDATRAIELYCSLFSGAVIDGIEQGSVSSGVDIGAQAEPTPEAALEATEEEVPQEDAPAEEISSEETPAEEAPVEEAAAEEDATEEKAD